MSALTQIRSALSIESLTGHCSGVRRRQAWAVNREDPHRAGLKSQEAAMPVGTTLVFVQDGERLLDPDSPDQTLPPFDAPDDVDVELPFVLHFRLRPDTTSGAILLRTRLNNNVVTADAYHEPVKRPWIEVVRPGSLRLTGNELRFELLSLDGSPPPVGSQAGISNIFLVCSTV